MARVQQPKREVKVRHIMADGTERDSMKGFVLTYEACPEVYHILYQMSLERAERKMKQCQEKN